MENSFQTSFIPKKLMVSNSSEKEPKSFLSLISIFLLIVSILISAGLFLYKIYLTKQEETLSSSLAITRDSFEKNTIDELELFNKQTESATKILGNHIVLSPLFALLGEITIPQVQYTSFQQQTNEQGLFVEIEGLARDYRSIALQADMFNSGKGLSFKNVLFSDLTKDKNNNVSFNLKFSVDPSLLSYEKNDSLKMDIITPVTPAPTPVVPVIPDTTVTPNTPDVNTTTNVVPNNNDSLPSNVDNSTQ